MTDQLSFQEYHLSRLKIILWYLQNSCHFLPIELFLVKHIVVLYLILYMFRRLNRIYADQHQIRSFVLLHCTSECAVVVNTNHIILIQKYFIVCTFIVMLQE